MITQSLYQSILSYLGYASISLDVITPIAGIKNWLDYFDDMFRLKRTSVIYYQLRNGLCYKARTSTHDRAIIIETNLRKVYNPRGFGIRSKDIVVDIGAQIGTFAIFAAKSATDGRVIAFEPEDNNYSLLLENIKLNNRQNITTSNRAVAAKTGNGRLCITYGNTGGHSMFMRSKRRNEAIVVKAISLPDVFINYHLSHIDFLKIDAEGAEYDILFHLNDQLFRKIDKIAMEYHQIDKNRNHITMQRYLEGKGYTVVTKGLSGFPIGMLYAKRKDSES